jgi:hypothetical protein
VIVDSTYTYAVVAYNQYEFSDPSNFATILVVVPVELVSFSYEINEKNDVTLSWITATETNNWRFEIERKTVNYQWEKIGFVDGYGTTIKPQFYSFIDESLQTGKYQYRLKQIDYDGSFEYSDIVVVEIGIPNEFTLEQNYPNPFNPTTKIKFSIPFVETRDRVSVQLKVYDVLGNEVATLVNEEKPAGSYEVEWYATGLPSGIYFYQLTVGSFIDTKKMILLK